MANFYDQEREGRAAYQLPDAGENRYHEDIGGNVEPDRIEANMAFSEWLDSQGDSLPLPESFTQWLNQTGDAIYEG